MKRRNPYIEQEKRFRRNIQEMVPMIYAAFAVSLHRRYGFGMKRLIRVLSDTQDYWNAHRNGEIDIIEQCRQETGIDMISETTARERGIDGERV